MGKLRRLAEFISPFAASVNDFKTGNRLVTHEVDGEKLAPIICYEIINDESLSLDLDTADDLSELERRRKEAP